MFHRAPRTPPAEPKSSHVPAVLVVALFPLGMILLGSRTASVGAAEPRTERVATAPVEPDWLYFGEHDQVIKELTFYADILNHSRDRQLSFEDRPTTAHETTHLIHSYLRGKFTRQLGRRVNGFYVGSDKAVILDEPGIRKTQVTDFIPKSLRGERYEHYVVGQKDWDDTPLYLFDEWVAYVNDSVVAIEDAKSDTWDGTVNNTVHSCVEFFVYATALAMAVDKHDSRYFAANPQFQRFLCWHLKRSMETYRRGMRYEQFRWNPAYVRKLRTSTDAQAMREFVENKLGMDLQQLFD